MAVSCSKSFGIYRERTGALFAVAQSQDTLDRVQSNLVMLARTNYSMPPSHGAMVVRTILDDEQLTATGRRNFPKCGSGSRRTEPPLRGN